MFTCINKQIFKPTRLIISVTFENSVGEKLKEEQGGVVVEFGGSSIQAYYSEALPPGSLAVKSMIRLVTAAATAAAATRCKCARGGAA